MFGIYAFIFCWKSPTAIRPFRALHPPSESHAQCQTDFENAAYAVFVTLVTRAIIAFGLNFYVPLSTVSGSKGDGAISTVAMSAVVDRQGLAFHPRYTLT